MTAVRGGSSPLSTLGQRAGYATTVARAQALGISRGYLFHLERGAQVPGPELAARMAQLYGLPLGAITDAVARGQARFARRLALQVREARRDAS
jgi:hypothetical protein